MVRVMVSDMYDLLVMDMPLRPAMIVDFGIDRNGSHKHSLLQSTVRAGATVEELNDALGKGDKITALVKKYTKQDIAFETPYDMMI